MNEPLKRGLGLTIFLAMAALVALATGVIYPMHWHALITKYPAWSIYSLTAIEFLRLPAVIAIWFWSRSGVVAYVALTAASIPISSAMGVQFSPVGLVGTGLLLFLIRNKWEYMSWSISG